LGYFRKYEDTSITLHHIFCVGMLGFVVLSKRNGYMMVYFVFLGEITNPLLSLSEILDFYGVLNSVSKTLQGIFLLSFIVIRCTIASVLVFETQRHPEVSPWFKFFPATIAALSYEWTFMMLNKVGKLANDVRALYSILTSRCSKAISSP
jgi:hypothetical protein